MKMSGVNVTNNIIQWSRRFFQSERLQSLPDLTIPLNDFLYNDLHLKIIVDCKENPISIVIMLKEGYPICSFIRNVGHQRFQATCAEAEYLLYSNGCISRRFSFPDSMNSFEIFSNSITHFLGIFWIDHGVLKWRIEEIHRRTLPPSSPVINQVSNRTDLPSPISSSSSRLAPLETGPGSTIDSVQSPAVSARSNASVASLTPKTPAKSILIHNCRPESLEIQKKISEKQDYYSGTWRSNEGWQTNVIIYKALLNRNSWEESLATLNKLIAITNDHEYFVEICGYCFADIKHVPGENVFRVVSSSTPSPSSSFTLSTTAATASDAVDSSILLPFLIVCKREESLQSLYSWWHKIRIRKELPFREYTAVSIMISLAKQLLTLEAANIEYRNLSPLYIYLTSHGGYRNVTLDLVPLFLGQSSSYVYPVVPTTQWPVSVEEAGYVSSNSSSQTTQLLDQNYPFCHIDSYDVELLQVLVNAPELRPQRAQAVSSSLSRSQPGASTSFSIGVILVLLFFSESVANLAQAPIFAPIWLPTTNIDYLMRSIDKKWETFCNDPPVHLSMDVRKAIQHLIQSCTSFRPDTRNSLSTISNSLQSLLSTLQTLPKKLQLEEFLCDSNGQRIRRIGKGGFSTVYSAYHVKKKTHMALKKMNHVTQDAVELFQHEIKLLCELQNPYIVQMYGVLAADILPLPKPRKAQTPVASATAAAAAAPVTATTNTRAVSVNDGETTDSTDSRDDSFMLEQREDVFVPSTVVVNTPSHHAAAADQSHTGSSTIFQLHRNAWQVVMVCEYCPQGNLKTFLTETYRKRVPGMFQQNELPLITQLLYDIATGMEYLHSQNIFHRDVKPENILLTYSGRQLMAKVADFGISRKLEYCQSESYMSSIGTMVDAKGSLLYQAPEIFNRQKCNFLTDVYAFGLLMHDCLVTLNISHKFDYPFCSRPGYMADRFIMYFIDSIKNNEMKPLFDKDRDSPLKEISSPCKESFMALMEQTWQFNRKDRPAFTKIIEILDSIMDSEGF